MSYYISASQNQQTLAEQEMEAVQEASTVYLGAQWKRALAEKDTEIQRLRGEVAKLEKAQARAKAHDGDASESALVAEKDAEIQRLRGEVAKLEKAQARAKAHDGGDASESALVAEKDAEIQRLRGEVAKLEKVQAVVAERENFIKAQRSREAKLTTELQRLRDEFAKLKGGRLPSKEEAMAVAEQVAGGVSARGEHAPPPCSSPPEAVGDAPSISEMYEKFSKPFIPPNVLKAPPVQLETIDKLRRDALRLGARPASRRKPEEKGKPASVVELPSVPTEEHKALEEVPPGDARGRGTVTPPPTSGAAKLVPGAAPLARSTPPKAPSDSSSAKDGTPAVEDAAVGEQANRQVGVSLSSGVVLTVRRLNKSESTLDDSSSTEEEPNKCVSPKGAVGIASKTSKDGEKAKEVAGAGKLEIRQLKRDLSSSSPSDGSYSTESVTPVKRVDHPRKSKPPPSENSFDKTTDDEPEELSKPVQKRASSPTAKPADSKSAVAKSKGNPPSGTAGEKKRATKKETKQPSAKGNAFDSSDTAASSITLTL
ncbi:hypothetical protein ERJ75_001527700 [Trypanosoma vivax]|nr:hypothetical protein ERJ75_001527700 [Trypanosoma vivax]